jgi:folate-binding protein YgfZ
MVPAVSLAEYRAAREQVALVARHDVGRVMVTGRDRGSYLHGLLTNDITGLKAGQGCYAAYLTAQGRMITDLWVYDLGDAILITLPALVKDSVLARLDQSIFTEDVRLRDVTGKFAGIAAVGPLAAAAAARVLGDSAESLTALQQNGNRSATFQGRPAIVLEVEATGEPGYELLVDPAQSQSLREALHAAGAVDLNDVVAETLRVEAGIPKFGVDMTEETIPLEAGIEGRAISMTKGCYVGQEVIVRVLHRGHGRVARRLVGLRIVDGDAVPSAGSVVRFDGHDVGRVTSAAWSPRLQRGIALAYLHRDHAVPEQRVDVNGADTEVVNLPFVAPRREK